jgi:hypothetical protein
MMFGQDRQQLRRFYYQSWQKQQQQQPMEALERMIAEVVSLHPEYHALLADEAQGLDKDYTPEMGQTNPFLHMGLHIAIHEQLGADRPVGIRQAYQKLLHRTQDAHQTEHLIMDCLGEALWQAQRDGKAPDEAAYLQRIKQLSEYQR